MKILLASLSIEEQNRFSHNPDCAYPLGMAYLHSSLEERGHEVQSLFLNNYQLECAEKVFFENVENNLPEIIGFQIFTMNRVASFRAIEKLRLNYPSIKIIVGGVHVSVMYEQVLKKYPYLTVVIGEGELTAVELVEAFDKAISLDLIQGVAYVKDGRVILNQPRALISNLDILPRPKHEVFFDAEPKRVIAHIISSRGCPFNCSFCCLKIISQRRWRKRDINKVVEEILYLKKTYPRLQHIQFHDDTFILDNNRVIEFCKLIIKEKLGITFECSARVKPISREMFYWMEKAGFTKIMFGLETGSPELLQSIGKGINQKDVMNLFNILKDFNMTVTTFLMCGFPGENPRTISETISFVQRLQKIKYSWIAGVGKLIVYPGTSIYDEMKKANRINDDYWLTENPVPYYTVEYTDEQLTQFENLIVNGVSLERIFTYRGFVAHFLKMPWQIIRFLYMNPNHLVRLVENSNIFVIKPLKIAIRALKFLKRNMNKTKKVLNKIEI